MPPQKADDVDSISGLTGAPARNVGSLGVIGAVAAGFLGLVMFFAWMFREELSEQRATRRLAIEHADKSIETLRSEMRYNTDSNRDSMRRMWEGQRELINLQRQSLGLPPKKDMASDWTN